MADKSAIEWLRDPSGRQGATWNPVVGCSLVSAGCTNCYAMLQAHDLVRRFGSPKYAGLTHQVNGNPVWTGTVRIDEASILQPLRWTRPRKIFTNSMSDLFHEALTDADIDRILAVMMLAPQHIYLTLTKRDDRMQAYLSDPNRPAALRQAIAAALPRIAETLPGLRPKLAQTINAALPHNPWPAPHLWWGASVENRRALPRLEALRATPAAVRFASAEPLLEDLGQVDLSGIDLVITGGESGPRARPTSLAAIRSLRDQSIAAGTAFHFKQWGAFAPQDDATAPDGTIMVKVGKRAAGRLLDGRTWDQSPLTTGSHA